MVRAALRLSDSNHRGIEREIAKNTVVKKDLIFSFFTSSVLCKVLI